jgi:16S rRNA (guanine1207-N2)-methyltransferase
MIRETDASHYFDEEPSTPSRPRMVTLELPDMTMELVTDAGVFGAQRVDPGTRTLLVLAPDPPPAGEILDLGCGYGPIALAIARRAPRARIWAVDVNQRALELVRRNADRLGVSNVTACRPEEVPDELRFTAIYSNPPVRIGKQVLHEMLIHWLQRLAASASAFLVVHKRLGGDSLAEWTRAQGFPTRRIGSRSGFRVLEVASVPGE